MKFVLNKPVALTEPTVIVDAGLPVGQRRFRLQVVNEQGQRSLPVEVTVSIIRQIPITDTRTTPIVVTPVTPITPT